MRGGFRLLLLPWVIAGSLVSLSQSSAAEPARSVDDWLSEVARRYAEDDWIEKSRRRPQGYMRPRDDTGWQTRMRALHAVVSLGDASIGPLVDALESGKLPERVFAAQALGYLGSSVPVEPLLRAAREDESPAVRLYAVDALGMRGNAGKLVDWKGLFEQEKDRDVRKHIGYAIERQNTALDKDVVKTLAEWAPNRMNTAVVGKMAPDFQLTSASGEAVRLSEYRGKQAVVLVFVYGDT